MPATYATLATGDLSAQDGYRYRYQIQGAGATVDEPLSVRILSGLPRWSVEGGGIAAATPLSPLMPCEASVTILDPSRGGLARLTDSADGEIRLRILRDSAKDGSFAAVHFVGPLNNVGASVNPFNPAYDGAPFGVSFTDGFGQLAGKPFAMFNPTGVATPPQEETLQVALQSILFPMLGATYSGSAWEFPDGSLQGLRMATNWYPWLGAGVEQIPETRNPLRAIYVRARSFIDEDGQAVDQLTALKQLCARVGARLFQSGGKLWLIQRELLARNPGAVPYWGSGPGESGIRVVTDLRTDVRAAETAYDYATSEGPALGLTPPVAEVRSTYDYAPDTVNYVLNGSFETRGLAGGQDSSNDLLAKYWDLDNSGAYPDNKPRRVNLAGFVNPIFDPGGIYNPSAYNLRNEAFAPQTNNSFAVLLPQFPSAFPRIARQRSWVRVNSNARAQYRFAATALLFKGGANTGVAQRPAVRVALRDRDGKYWGLYAGNVEVQSRGYAGEVRTLETAKALSDVLVGIPAGALLADVGATLRVYRDPYGRRRDNGVTVSGGGYLRDETGDTSDGRWVAEIQLTRPYRVGDTQVQGNVTLLDDTKTINPAWQYDPPSPPFPGSTVFDFVADKIRVYYWAPLGDGDWLETTPDEKLPDEWPFKYDFSAPGVDVEGTPVRGYLDVSLRGSRFSDSGRNMVFFDGVSFVDEGDSDGELTYAASLGENAIGQTADLPIGTGDLTLGDGPTTESVTRLRASADLGITIRDTVRGNGQLTAWRAGSWGTDVPNREQTIDGLSAVSGLQQLGGQAETWGGTVLAPADGTLALYPHLAQLVNQFGTILQDATAGSSTIYAAYAPEPGTPVTLSCRSTTLAETRTVDSVEPYGKGYKVTLTAALSNNHSASDPTQNGLLYSLRIWPDVFAHTVEAGAYEVTGTRLVFGPDATAYPDDALIIGGEPVLIDGDYVYI